MLKFILVKAVLKFISVIISEKSLLQKTKKETAKTSTHFFHGFENFPVKSPIGIFLFFLIFGGTKNAAWIVNMG